MRENILSCSILSDRIDALTSKAIEFETRAETSKTDKEFYLNYSRYKEIKSELKYQETIYKKDCGMYNLFCKNLFK